MKKAIFCCLPILVNFFLISLALAEESPIFQNRILTVPRVDTEIKVGQYQNVRFKLADDGRWDLQAATEAKAAMIDASQVVVVSSKPTQAFVKASGNFPSGCYGLGAINVRREGNLFEVAVNQVELQTFAVCTQALVPFSVTVPLEVYGLAAGTYQVSINGRSNTFMLAVDNYLE